MYVCTWLKIQTKPLLTRELIPFPWLPVPCNVVSRSAPPVLSPVFLWFLPSVSLTDFVPPLDSSLVCGRSVLGYSVLFPLSVDCKYISTCQNVIHFLYHQKQGKYPCIRRFILFLQAPCSIKCLFYKTQVSWPLSASFPLMFLESPHLLWWTYSTFSNLVSPILFSMEWSK